MINPNAEHVLTDYGFVLYIAETDGFAIEIYGMVGIGRYELAQSCSCLDEDDRSEMLRVMEEECDSMDVYRATKKALATARGG